MAAWLAPRRHRKFQLRVLPWYWSGLGSRGSSFPEALEGSGNRSKGRTREGRRNVDRQCLAWPRLQLGEDALVNQDVEGVERGKAILH